MVHPSHPHRADLQAVSDLLGDKPFLFGSVPSLADVSVFAFVTCFLYLPEDSESHFKRILSEDFPTLVALHQRIRERHWADWPLYKE